MRDSCAALCATAAGVGDEGAETLLRWRVWATAGVGVAGVCW